MIRIRRLDMFDWLSWSLYGQPYEVLVAEREKWEADGRPEVYIEGTVDNDDHGIEIEGDKLGLVEHCVDLVEARAGKPFLPGRNKDIKVIRLTLDPVRVVSRPFILYAFVWTLQKVIVSPFLALPASVRKRLTSSTLDWKCSNQRVPLVPTWIHSVFDATSTQLEARSKRPRVDSTPSLHPRSRYGYGTIRQSPQLSHQSRESQGSTHRRPDSTPHLNVVLCF